MASKRTYRITFFFCDLYGRVQEEEARCEDLQSMVSLVDRYLRLRPVVEYRIKPIEKP